MRQCRRRRLTLVSLCCRPPIDVSFVYREADGEITTWKITSESLHLTRQQLFWSWEGVFFPSPDSNIFFDFALFRTLKSQHFCHQGGSGWAAVCPGWFGAAAVNNFNWSPSNRKAHVDKQWTAKHTWKHQRKTFSIMKSFFFNFISELRGKREKPLAHRAAHKLSFSRKLQRLVSHECK